MEAKIYCGLKENSLLTAAIASHCTKTTIAAREIGQSDSEYALWITVCQEFNANICLIQVSSVLVQTNFYITALLNSVAPNRHLPLVAITGPLIAIEWVDPAQSKSVASPQATIQSPFWMGKYQFFLVKKINVI